MQYVHTAGRWFCCLSLGALPPPAPLCAHTNQAQSICFKIQCDQYLQTAAKDATGERAAGLQALASTLTGKGITVSNIVDYMSLIEQRSVQVSRHVQATTRRN